jgi:hypothetical protein
MADDESRHKYYSDPENRVPAGPGRRRASKTLSTHVPIRFTQEVIAEVKQLAEKDRKSVSSWIRDAVEAEIERRRPRETQSFAPVSAPPTINWVQLNRNVQIFGECEQLTVPDAKDSAAPLSRL